MRLLCSISLALVVSSSLAAGCAESHGVGSACAPSDPAPFGCYARYDGNVCGDVGESAVCMAGTWQCPAGTVSQRECWCTAGGRPGCVCTPSGWSCPSDDASVRSDASVLADAGPEACPADPAAAQGTPCRTEGQSCGTCNDPCGFCNLLLCTSGTWQTLEALPPPCTSTTFACGPTTQCTRFGEYCQHTLSDVVGIPDDFRCMPFPPSCTSNTCACFTGTGPGTGGCVDDGSGAVTLTGGGA